jgi:extradiol dioxygenase family protein
MPHFGCVLDWNIFYDLVDKLQSKDFKFIIKPSVRFLGLPGEQATMFFEDISGNAIELKAYRNPSEVFTK